MEKEREEAIKAAEQLYVYHGKTCFQIAGVIPLAVEIMQEYEKTWKLQREAFLALPESGETEITRLILQRLHRIRHGKPATTEGLLKLHQALTKERDSFPAFVKAVTLINTEMQQIEISDRFITACQSSDPHVILAGFRQEVQSHITTILSKFKLALLSQGGKV